MIPRVPLREALSDPNLLGTAIAGDSWRSWRTRIQRQLARRCALLSVECEKLEAISVRGEPIDLDIYGTLTDRLGRCFQRLGLRRVPKNVTPDLRDYLEERVNMEAAE